MVTGADKMRINKHKRNSLNKGMYVHPTVRAAVPALCSMSPIASGVHGYVVGKVDKKLLHITASHLSHLFPPKGHI